MSKNKDPLKESQAGSAVMDAPAEFADSPAEAVAKPPITMDDFMGPKTRYRCSLGKNFLVSEHEAINEQEAQELFKKQHKILKWGPDADWRCEPIGNANGSNRRSDNEQKSDSGEPEGDDGQSEAVV